MRRRLLKFCPVAAFAIFVNVIIGLGFSVAADASGKSFVEICTGSGIRTVYVAINDDRPAEMPAKSIGFECPIVQNADHGGKVMPIAAAGGLEPVATLSSAPSPAAKAVVLSAWSFPRPPLRAPPA